MLLQSNKELAICGDLHADDVFFYYTTTSVKLDAGEISYTDGDPTIRGWMMWNFLVGGLSIGCTLVLYDGSPLRDVGYLWKLVDDLGITIFGTSAKYLDQLSVGNHFARTNSIAKMQEQKKYRPREHHSLKTLRHLYSTGSPLAPPLFDYVYEDIKPNLILGSITGVYTV